MRANSVISSAKNCIRSSELTIPTSTPLLLTIGIRLTPYALETHPFDSFVHIGTFAGN